MRAACFAPSSLEKRGVMEGGWLQAGSFHFNEKILALIGHYSMNFTIFNPLLQNEPCNGDSGRKGTCYTEQECGDLGGKKVGSTCADGFGVCCQCKSCRTTHIIDVLQYYK